MPDFSLFLVKPDIYAIFHDLITEVLHLEFLKTVKNAVNLVNKASVPGSVQCSPSSKEEFLQPGDRNQESDFHLLLSPRPSPSCTGFLVMGGPWRRPQVY